MCLLMWSRSQLMPLLVSMTSTVQFSLGSFSFKIFSNDHGWSGALMGEVSVTILEVDFSARGKFIVKEEIVCPVIALPPIAKPACRSALRCRIASSSARRACMDAISAATRPLTPVRVPFVTREQPGLKMGSAYLHPGP